MFRKIQRWLDWTESRISLWKILTGGYIVSTGGIGAWVASATEWLDAYGPISWFFAALLAGLVATLLFAAFSWGRYRWESAKVMQRWGETSEAVNPLESEFQKKRVHVLDLVHPVYRNIQGKRFIDCELIGPANISIGPQCNIQASAFTNCDLVVVNSARVVPVNNVAIFRDVSVIGGEIINCTILIPPGMVSIFQDMGSDFITLTGDPEIDSPPQLDTGQETQPKSPPG